MTQEEKDLLLKDLCARLPNNPFDKGGNNQDLFGTNTHHFDYRGLLEIHPKYV